jgi:hypothetical protein
MNPTTNTAANMANNGMTAPLARLRLRGLELASLLGSSGAHIARAGRVAEWFKAPVLKFECAGIVLFQLVSDHTEKAPFF